MKPTIPSATLDAQDIHPEKANSYILGPNEILIQSADYRHPGYYAPEWILVSDRCPTAPDFVWKTFPDVYWVTLEGSKHVVLALYCMGWFHPFGHPLAVKPIAWKPIGTKPEPYRP